MLADEEIDQIKKSESLVFQTAGDTGAVRGQYQEEVSRLMVEDADRSNVKFFYHLGDVVYDYGENREYPGQFYDVYANYRYPIFAIPAALVTTAARTRSEGSCGTSVRRNRRCRRRSRRRGDITAATP